MKTTTTTGRPRLAPSSRRSFVIKAKFTEAEHAQLVAAAGRAGLPSAVFVRKAALGRPSEATGDPLAPFVMARIAAHLEQIAAWARQCPDPVDAVSLVAALLRVERLAISLLRSSRGSRPREGDAG